VETTQQQMAKDEPSQPVERGGTSSREVVAVVQRHRILSSNWLKWLIPAILLLSALVAVGIARVWKKTKGAKSVLPLLLCGLLAMIPDAHAEEFVVPSPTRAPGYEIVGAGGKSIPIDQCGLNSTLFALNFYNRAFNVELIKNSLRPEPNGISMQHIRQVLQGYGLDAYGRRLSNTHDLNRVFQRKSIVIIAPSIHARIGHYYIVVPALEQDSFLLVDPVRSVETETTEEILKRLAEAGGVVLVVCEPQGETSPQAHQIQIDSELDFGELSMTSDTSCRRELTIHNKGRLPVMISRIAGSCSCMVTEWTGGLIEPRSERKIAVVITPKEWGAGPKKKPLVVFCGDGSTKVCALVGTGLMPENWQRIVVTPKKLYFDISSGDREAYAKYVYIHQPKNDVRPVRVDTADCPPWILVQVLEQATKEAPGRIVVDLKDETIVEQQTEARFRVFTDDTKEPVEVRVHVLKRKPYSLSTRMLIVDGSTTKCKFMVSLESNRTPDFIKITNIEPSCSEIMASLIPADSTPGLQVMVSEHLVKGLHKIDLSLKSNTGDEFSEIIHVLCTR
jgi:hypothetical protein